MILHHKYKASEALMARNTWTYVNETIIQPEAKRHSINAFAKNIPY